MIKSFLHIKHYRLIALLLACVLVSSFKKQHNEAGKLRITFLNKANGKDIVLRDSIYKNAFGEEYTVSKLKYYISHFFVAGSKQSPEDDPYHLISAAEGNDNSFEISLAPGRYSDLEFLLGVDSARNCSGAQTGALDPMNDMFWTWNSGYVMFKLEGTSSSSKSDLQRIEHHIGGYKGDNNVVTKIKLHLADPDLLEIKEAAVTDIFVETNLDNYWNGSSEIKISEHPLCMTTGALAKKMAANFTKLFSVTGVRK